MTHTLPEQPADIPSPDAPQVGPTQLSQKQVSSPMWGSPPKVWASWGWRVAFFCVACVVAWQSLLPAGQEGGIPHMDKVVHCVAYAVLCGLALLGRFSHRSLWVAGFIILFGVSIEILQGIMDLGRTASLADAVANTAGVGLAWFVWTKFRRKSNAA